MMICDKCGYEVIWFSHDKITHGKSTPFRERFHKPKVKQLSPIGRPAK